MLCVVSSSSLLNNFFMGDNGGGVRWQRSNFFHVCCIPISYYSVWVIVTISVLVVEIISLLVEERVKD